MPTIDQLAPATASSDTDELVVSQNGIARKISRAQVVAGLQQQITMPSRAILGRSSSGTGAPEAISIGANLSISNGVLSASVGNFAVTSLPSGVVPGATDLVPVSQSGANAAVSYAGFMSGLTGLTGIDVSRLSVTPTGSGAAVKLADLAAGMLPTSGGQMLGALTLAADPVQVLHPATKRYVDAQTSGLLSKAGGALTGPVLLSGDPTAALQPATKQYVDGRASTLLPLTGGSLSGKLSLPADPAAPLEAATKQYVDAQAATALPKSGGAVSGVILLAADPSAAMQAATKQYVDGRVARSGDAMTGTLVLASDPVQPLQAATKNYVDLAVGANGVLNVKSTPFGAKLDGRTDDTAAFKAAYQAAPANSVIYVPAGMANIANPNSWGIPLTKRVKWVVDGTMTPDGTPLASGVPSGAAPGNYFLPGIVTGNSSVAAEVSQTGSSPTDFSVFHSSYVVGHAGGPTGGVVATNHRTDTIIYNSPNNYIWGGLDRLQWNGTQTPDANNPAQHVARYIQAIRATAGTDGSGNVLPQPQVWATCVQYVDQTGLPTSKTNAAQGMELDFHANGLDDMNGGDGGRYLASFALLQADTSGAPVEAANGLLVTLISGHQGSFKRALRVAAPFSQAAICTRWSQQLSGAHAVWLATGHHIAFNTEGTCFLAYDQSTNTLRSVRGSQSNPIGVGISLGWQTVIASSATLDPSTTGNIVLCIASTPVTINLPPLARIAAGTGWLFTNIGAADVTISPTSGDRIDNGPVVLHPNERYCIVSDQWQNWREVFRSNSVNPRFAAPITLANYVVASLPSGQPAGAKAFATNG